MLQQTQVERVVPKFIEFMERFPTLQSLAESPRSEVIRRWAPLGYNRRAVRLHMAAQQVVAECEGELPSSQEALARLQGIGEYTSAAVACFAFDRQVAVVDTNVRRVLGRIFADRFKGRPTSPKSLTELATSVLPQGRAPEWSQSLMDLGATICTARVATCDRCPVGDLCSGRAELESGPARSAARKLAEQPGTYRAQGAFAGSSRYYRGRIVEALRNLPLGGDLTIDDLGARIRQDYCGELRGWLLELVRKLGADGLLRLQGSGASGTGIRISLP